MNEIKIQRGKILTALFSMTVVLAPMDPVLLMRDTGIIGGMYLSLYRIMLMAVVLSCLLCAPIIAKWLSLLKNRSYVYILMWLIISLISNLWSFDPAASLKGSVIIISSFILLTISGFLGLNGKANTVLNIIFGLSIIFALIEDFTGFRLPAFRQWAFKWELTSFYVNPSHLGCTLAMIFPFVFGRVILGKQRMIKVFWLMMLILMSYITIRTGAKGALFALGLEILIMLLMSASKLKQNRPFLPVLTIVSIILIAFVSFFSYGIIPESTQYKVKEITSILAPRDWGNVESYRSRLSVWEQGLKLAGERPIIGWGIGCSDSLMEIHSPEVFTVSLHNAWLKILIETGIFGLSFFLISFCFILAALLKKNVKSSSNYDPYFLSLIGFIPISVTIGSIEGFAIFWIILGFSLARISKAENVLYAYSPRILLNNTNNHVKIAT